MGTVKLYDPAPVPPVPDHTAAITDPLADGQYWATAATAAATAATTVQFGLAEASFDDAGALTVDDTRSAMVTADDPVTPISVVAADRRNLAVTLAELAHLVDGANPDPAAPAWYRFVPYPFLVTVRSGAVVEVRQIWVESLAP